MYQLSQVLLHDLRLSILGNKEILDKSLNCIGTQRVQSPLEK